MNTAVATTPSRAGSPAPSDHLIIFAGGGSGGHIFPGLAIGAEIDRLSAPGRSPTLLYITSDRAIDAKIFQTLQIPVEASPAKPAIARPMGILRFIRGWLAAKRHAKTILTDLRAHRCTSVEVVAMGGFVAAPFTSAAKSLGVRVTMVNLDAIPGKANRYIAKRASRIFTATRVPPGHREGREWTEVPPIVRATARAILSRAESRARLNLDPSRPVLMITGGSQGLRSLNNFVTAFAASPEGQRTLRDGRWQVLHQTGRNLDQAVAAAYQAAGIDATVVPFNDLMGLWWGAANAAICTAGAGNIAEIWMNKVPALLLPYPHHKDEHQKYNALPLTDSNAAILGKDWIDPQQNLAHNAGLLQTILSDESRRAAMRANLEKLGPADGATRIAQALLDG